MIYAFFFCKGKLILEVETILYLRSWAALESIRVYKCTVNYGYLLQFDKLIKIALQASHIIHYRGNTSCLTAQVAFIV
jgi:hypothetical protein